MIAKVVCSSYTLYNGHQGCGSFAVVLAIWPGPMLHLNDASRTNNVQLATCYRRGVPSPGSVLSTTSSRYPRDGCLAGLRVCLHPAPGLTLTQQSTPCEAAIDPLRPESLVFLSHAFMFFISSRFIVQQHTYCVHQSALDARPSVSSSRTRKLKCPRQSGKQKTPSCLIAFALLQALHPVNLFCLHTELRIGVSWFIVTDTKRRNSSSQRVKERAQSHTQH